MQAGIIGLGRMGMNMARRLINGGHGIVVYNRSQDKVKQMETEGAIASATIEEFVEKLEKPRTAIIMLPAGKIVDMFIDKLAGLMSPGDIMIDGGNTYYKDDIRRAQVLKEKGIHYMDAGISGGIWGLKNGYCTMIGGDRADFEHIKPLIETLAPAGGYLYCGEVGAGHFAKMVHNGIEYAMMQAYGEGFALLKASRYADGLDFSDIAHLWNQGSVIRSWLLELLESVFEKDPDISKIEGYVEDSGEGRWSVIEGIESGVPTPAIAVSLFKRFESRDKNLFSDRIIAALRNEFGGHSVVMAGQDITTPDVGKE